MQSMFCQYFHFGRWVQCVKSVWSLVPSHGNAHDHQIKRTPPTYEKFAVSSTSFSVGMFFIISTSTAEPCS